MAKDRVAQIDILKGLAALSVVATHSYRAPELISMWAVFHIWQAVPVFIVILGVTSSMSFERRGANHPLKLLSADYLIRRGVRILVPFALVWVLAALVGVSRGQSLILDFSTALLRLPYGAPGNYFVPVVVAFVLLAPFAFAAYRRWPLATLVVAFAADLAFEVVAARISVFTEDPYMYSIAFPRYLAAFAIGFWLADARVSQRLRWTVLAVGATFSAAYLVTGNLELVTVPFVPDWRTQNVLAVFVPALMVALGLRLLPQRSCGIVGDGLCRVGRASYHIFLLQMLYFVIVGQGKDDLLVVSLVLCTFLGIGFFAAEEWLRCRLRRRKVEPDSSEMTAEDLDFAS